VRLPAQIPPILIVQHIPAVFSEAFANRMDTLCPFKVSEAKDGDIVESGHVYVAPGGKQMKLIKKGAHLQLSITDDEPVNRHKPSVDYLFDSVAALKPPKLVSVILTGMGGDGARGMKKLRDLGAATIAQNEESCVVFGMPREAIKLGGAEKILHLDQIADEIVNLVKEKASKIKSAAP
jgi:two-component system chemotaxis response regulator CheB